MQLGSSLHNPRQSRKVNEQQMNTVPADRVLALFLNKIGHTSLTKQHLRIEGTQLILHSAPQPTDSALNVNQGSMGYRKIT